MNQNQFFKTRLLFDHSVVREQFTDFFPPSDFDSYTAFLRAPGECIKSEPRTRVFMLKRGRSGAANENPERFICKEYHYPFLPRLRTWLRHSKAEHEFRSLLEVTRQGIKAAEAVAFGTRRTLFGYVRSCFIITRYVENSFTLEEWIKEADRLAMSEAELNWSISGALGRTFRTLHEARFFLFTGKPRNILVRRTADIPEIIIINLPYALHISKQPLARWAQAVDLAVFLGNFERASSEEQKASFYAAYLPDPLGDFREDLERRVRAAIRWRRTETPVSSLVHSIRRAGTKWQHQKRKRTSSLRADRKLLLALFESSYITDASHFETAISLVEMML